MGGEITALGFGARAPRHAKKTSVAPSDGAESSSAPRPKPRRRRSLDPPPDSPQPRERSAALSDPNDKRRGRRRAHRKVAPAPPATRRERDSLDEIYEYVVKSKLD
jgi:hypothetical protein